MYIYIVAQCFKKLFFATGSASQPEELSAIKMKLIILALLIPVLLVLEGNCSVSSSNKFYGKHIINIIIILFLRVALSPMNLRRDAVAIAMT